MPVGHIGRPSMWPMRVRFTVRWIMAAVAVVAVLLFAVVQLDRFRKLGVSG